MPGASETNWLPTGAVWRATCKRSSPRSYRRRWAGKPMAQSPEHALGKCNGTSSRDDRQPRRAPQRQTRRAPSESGGTRPSRSTSVTPPPARSKCCTTGCWVCSTSIRISSPPTSSCSPPTWMPMRPSSKPYSARRTGFGSTSAGSAPRWVRPSTRSSTSWHWPDHATPRVNCLRRFGPHPCGIDSALTRATWPAFATGWAAPASAGASTPRTGPSLASPHPPTTTGTTACAASCSHTRSPTTTR